MNETSDSQPFHVPELGRDRSCLSRLLTWRVLRRWLFGAACLVTLIGLFYAVEDWRGKGAWEKCRRALESKGAVLDWSAYIPAPVPDDQNVFKAPKMSEWFVRASWTDALGRGQSKTGEAKVPFSLAPLPKYYDISAPLAEVEVVPSNGALPLGKTDAVLRFDEPASREQAAKLLRERIGPCADGATGQGLVARVVDQVNPVHLVVQADTVPGTQALADFLSPPLMHIAVAPAGSNAFRVTLSSRVYVATDYLAASEPAVPDLEVLREALKRPFVRMDGDYQRPFESPLPNFVRLRTVAQISAQRAQCYLLLGQPEAAWNELALVHDVCHMLDGKPAGDAPTLVAAMIDVAISGLYTSIIRDGLRLQVWREPELAAMQRQLAGVNFIPLLDRSFNAERAATCRTFEASTRAELRKLFSFGHEKEWFLDRLKDPTYLLVSVAPRGWIYQNMCVGAPLEQLLLEALDVPNQQVYSGKLDRVANELSAASRGRSPYSFLAAAALPNFVKATQTMARNQTLANEAYIACGLERFRLAHGEYPKRLEELVPRFAEKLPHDIIGGQPLRYERTADDRFVLYSVGWNGRDDGGVAGKGVGEGDWTWQ